MIDDYYKARGWDKKTGLPKKDNLEKIGMNDVGKELEKMKLVK